MESAWKEGKDSNAKTSQFAKVTRVTVPKSKNILFVVRKPDDHENPALHTYIILGDAKKIYLSKYS